MYELCTRAIKLFKKTRASASKSSIKGARELDQLAVHELFKDQSYNPDTLKMLEKIRNYKPKQSYLEFKNDSGEIHIGNSALKFLDSARKQTERFRKKIAIKNEKLLREEDSDDDEELDNLNDTKVEKGKTNNFNDEEDDDIEIDDEGLDDQDELDEETGEALKTNLQKRFELI